MNTPAITEAATPQAAKTASKSDSVLKLLSRPRGATIDEIGTATSWQAHSTRAFLSGLRKKGRVLDKEQRKNGATSYRIAKAPASLATLPKD